MKNYLVTTPNRTSAPSRSPWRARQPLGCIAQREGTTLISFQASHGAGSSFEIHDGPGDQFRVSPIHCRACDHDSKAQSEATGRVSQGADIDSELPRHGIMQSHFGEPDAPRQRQPLMVVSSCHSRCRIKIIEHVFNLRIFYKNQAVLPAYHKGFLASGTYQHSDIYQKHSAFVLQQVLKGSYTTHVYQPPCPFPGDLSPF